MNKTDSLSSPARLTDPLRKTRSLRSAIALLLLVSFVPLTLVSAAFLWRQWELQRDGAMERLHDRARALQLSVDRELALHQSVLATLATSEAIDRRDWAAFDAAAREAAAVRPGTWIILLDREGRMLVNTSVPYGTPLPRMAVEQGGARVEWQGRLLPAFDPAVLWEPLENGRPAYSDLFYGPVVGGPVLATSVPVMRGGRPVFALANGYTPGGLSELLKGESEPGAAWATIIDGRGTVVARSRNAAQSVGRTAPPPFDRGGADLPPAGDGVAETLEQEAGVYAYARSSLAGWTMLAAMPRSEIFAPALRSLLAGLLALVLLGAGASWLAHRLWRELALPLSALARYAKRREGEPVEEPAPARIEEIETLGVALREAAQTQSAWREEAALRLEIEERERAGASRYADELREGEERLQVALEAGALAAWDLNLTLGTAWRSPQHARIFGYIEAPERWGFDDLLAHVLPEDRRRVEAAFRVAVEQVRALEFQCRIRRDDGAVRWIWVQGRTRTGPGGDTQRIFGVIQDITTQKQAEEALRESEALFRLVANSIPQIAWTATPDGRLDFCNDRFNEFVGAGSPCEGPLAVPFHEDDRERTLALWSRAIETGGEFECEHRLRAADGTYHWHLSRAIPVRDAQGTIIKWYGSSTDIHEVKRAAEALREADRRKDEFLAMLAHELRNPLAPITSSLEVMRRLDLKDPTVRRLQAMMERQARQLARLVDDLLDVSRITSGKVALRRRRLPLAEVVERAADAVRPAMEACGHAFTVLLPREPIWIEGDEVRLAQVIGNVLDNAAKYTEPGGSVVLSVQRAQGEAVIRVADTGAGIPPELLPQVFDLFTQGDRSPDRVQGGLGIGLTIVKRLVDMHGGRVRVESNGTQSGTLVELRLPVEAGPAEAPAARGEAPAHRLSLLVVDDNRDAAESLALLLRVAGHRVRTADCGTLALARALEEAPEAMLVDIGMPGMDGYELARRVRALPALARVALVAVTGYGGVEDQRLAREAGFDRHLLKPVEADTLERVLRELAPAQAAA